MDEESTMPADNVLEMPGPGAADDSNSCAATKSAIKHLFCPMMGVLSGGTSRQINAQTRDLLIGRLKAVAAIALFAQLLFLARPLVFAGIPLFPQQLVALAVVVASLVVLFRRRKLSLLGLRAIELMLFGCIGIHLMVVNYLTIDLNLANGPEAAVVNGLYRTVIGYFALMTIYGCFIPNTWQRTAIVITPLLLATPSLSLLLSRRDPALGFAAAASLEDLTYAGSILLIGAAIAVVGSHIINRMRYQVARIAEMGLYRLEEKIGAGGMGEVWRARHRMLARPAAIKTIRRDVVSAGDAADTATKRFEREAQVTASLRSPHTVELYDFGVTNEGTFYYVMEYLDGLDLDSLVKRFVTAATRAGRAHPATRGRLPR